MSEYLTPAKATQFVSYNEVTIRRWCREGLFPCFLGEQGKYQFTLQDLQDYIRSFQSARTSLSAEQAAQIVGVSVSNVRKWCQDGRIKAEINPHTKQWEIDRASILEYVEIPHGYITAGTAIERYHYSESGIAAMAKNGHVRHIRRSRSIIWYCAEDIEKYAGRDTARAEPSKEQKAQDWFVKRYNGKIPTFVPASVRAECQRWLSAHPDTINNGLTLARRKLGLSRPNKRKAMEKWLRQRNYIWLPMKVIFELAREEFTQFEVTFSTLEKAVHTIRKEFHNDHATTKPDTCEERI